MPYAPGASYQGGQFIASGRNNLIQAIATLVGGLTAEAGQAKEARATLNELYPAESDKWKKMSNKELQGAIQAKEMETKMQAANTLQQEAKLRISALQSQQADKAELGPFAAAVQRNLQPSAPVTSSGLPASGPPSPAMGPLSAFMGAAAQFPGGAEAFGLGRAGVLGPLVRGATPGAADKFGIQQVTLPNGVSGAIDAAGRFIPSPEYEKSLNAWRAGTAGGSRAAQPPQIPEGAELEQAKTKEGKDIRGMYHVTKGGKRLSSFFNPHEATGTSKVDAFLNAFGANASTTGKTGFNSPADVKAAYQKGTLSYDAAAQILQSQFQIGVTPASQAAAATVDETPAPDEETQ